MYGEFKSNWHCPLSLSSTWEAQDFYCLTLSPLRYKTVNWIFLICFGSKEQWIRFVHLYFSLRRAGFNTPILEFSIPTNDWKRPELLDYSHWLQLKHNWKPSTRLLRNLLKKVVSYGHPKWAMGKQWVTRESPIIALWKWWKRLRLSSSFWNNAIKNGGRAVEGGEGRSGAGRGGQGRGGPTARACCRAAPPDRAAAAAAAALDRTSLDSQIRDRRTKLLSLIGN